MEEYARSSVASPNTPGGVSIYSRGSYHFLRTANTNGNDSLMLKKEIKIVYLCLYYLVRNLVNLN